MIDFFKSRAFWLNIFLAVVIVGLFFWGAGFYLSSCTRHGQFIVMPNLDHLRITDVQKLLKQQDLKYIVIDSSYDEHSQGGLVFYQNPYAGAKVKSGRNVYLKITTSTPPLVDMPDLVDKSIRQALNMLQNSGLKRGQIKEVQNPLSGFVIAMKYKGNDIEAGTKLSKGSVIDLEVAKGSLPDSLRN